ncbi:MAG: type II toxin-antitoxin system prevent-host-death family antitoxin [Chloroflexota bacterium]
MRTATITEVKNGLSALIDQVRAGESILITDRGLVVARLEPVTATPDPTGRLHRLERAGVIRIGDAPPPLDRLRVPAPRLPAGTSAVRAVIDERRLGR